MVGQDSRTEGCIGGKTAIFEQSNKRNKSLFLVSNLRVSISHIFCLISILSVLKYFSCSEILWTLLLFNSVNASRQYNLRTQPTILKELQSADSSRIPSRIERNVRLPVGQKVAFRLRTPAENHSVRYRFTVVRRAGT